MQFGVCLLGISGCVLQKSVYSLFPPAAITSTVHAAAAAAAAALPPPPPATAAPATTTPTVTTATTTTTTTTTTATAPAPATAPATAATPATAHTTTSNLVARFREPWLRSLVPKLRQLPGQSRQMASLRRTTGSASHRSTPTPRFWGFGFRVLGFRILGFRALYGLGFRWAQRPCKYH